MLPHDLPPYRIVFHYCRTWQQDGIWQQVNGALRQQTRQRRHYVPPVGENHRKRWPRGYDAGKKVMGCERHIVVDTPCLLLAVVVHPADVPDRDGARLVLKELAGRFPRLWLIWADGGGVRCRYRYRSGWAARLEIVSRNAGQRGFAVRPARRWVMERTFGWLGRQRRLSKD